MKLLAFLVAVAAISVIHTGCTKDKTPNIVVNPDCSDTVSFSQDVFPLFQANCISCHDNGNGTGYTFADYGTISSNSNQAIGSMKGQGFQQMPQGMPPMQDAEIKLIECWIQNGKLNN